MTFGKELSVASAVETPTVPSETPTPPEPLRLRDLSPDAREWELHMRGILSHRPHVTDFRLSQIKEADEAIENAIGYVGVPLGLLPSLIVNGKEHVVPMATEERSVIASAAKAAKMCRATGGVTVLASPRPTVPVQIFYAAPPNPVSLQRRLFELLRDIEGFADDNGGHMVTRGGSPVSVQAAYRTGEHGEHVVLPLEIDTCDAMGANVVTRIAEKVAAFLHERHFLPRRTAAICSNDEAGWSVTATAVWTVPHSVRTDPVVHLSHWAAHDVHRAVTHNKGIMNGISAVALATGQDTRAIEACAHSSAMRNGTYSPLSTFGRCQLPCWTSALGGTLHLRIPCGTAGGATVMPFFKDCLDILGNPSARELACIMAAVGLVQNFAALWSLAGEGIPASHERLKEK